MSDLRKAAEMAYEVMTDIHQVCEGANHKRKDMHPYGDDCPIQKRFDDAWEALRQALAQPEQRGHCTCGEPEALGVVHFRTRPCFHYTHQPKREWVGLTDEEVSSVYKSHVLLAFYKPYRIEEYEWVFWLTNFARAIEAKLKEKNT